MVRNEHILYFRLLDPRMVDSSIMFTKYVSEWATNLRAISLNVGVTTFGPPCSSYNPTSMNFARKRTICRHHFISVNDMHAGHLALLVLLRCKMTKPCKTPPIFHQQRTKCSGFARALIEILATLKYLVPAAKNFYRQKKNRNSK